MQFGSIASGSSGNCLYVGNDDTHILIDAGISKKRIEEGLKSFEMDPAHIDGILVTHEHIDHVQGIGVWSRKYKVPIYGTRGTLAAMSRIKSLGAVDPSLFRIVNPGDRFNIGNMEVTAFSMPHDATDPVCYKVRDERVQLGMATDLGYFDQKILDMLMESDLLYIEANHDLRMLEVGPYPYQLKRRIAGNYGHLSNESSGKMIGQLLNKKIEHVVLGHLSKENNYPDLAYETVRAELLMHFGVTDGDIDLEVAPRDHALNKITI